MKKKYGKGVMLNKIREQKRKEIEEFKYFLDSITILCQSNVAEIEKLVEGGRMGGKKVELYLQNLFNNEIWSVFGFEVCFSYINVNYSDRHDN